jgi:hypothetical protein
VAHDLGNHVNITIIIAAAIVSGTIIAGETVIAVDSIVFIGRPSAQEASCRRVFLGRLITILVFIF